MAREDFLESIPDGALAGQFDVESIRLYHHGFPDGFILGPYLRLPARRSKIKVTLSAYTSR